MKSLHFFENPPYINGHHSSNTPTNHLAIELQHISKKYPILSVFYRYQKRFKYHILAHIHDSLHWRATMNSKKHNAYLRTFVPTLVSHYFPVGSQKLFFSRTGFVYVKN